MSLQNITELSRHYGVDSDFVLAEGGNISFKDDNFLYINLHGIALKDITESDFIKLGDFR